MSKRVTDIMPMKILVADDDADDRMMIEEAFDEVQAESQNDFVLEFVEDGEQLLEKLRSKGAFSGQDPNDYPGIILLDLNMPRKDGRVALQEIKEDPKLCRIPVVVLTTSKADEDVLRTYELGVSSFITKPVSFDSLIDLVKVMSQYWFQTVILPHREENGKK